MTEIPDSMIVYLGAEMSDGDRRSFALALEAVAQAPSRITDIFVRRVARHVEQHGRPNAKSLGTQPDADASANIVPIPSRDSIDISFGGFHPNRNEHALAKKFGEAWREFHLRPSVFLSAERALSHA